MRSGETVRRCKMPIRAELQDFYFSVSEARGEYFAGSTLRRGLILEYRVWKGQKIWATEVTPAGVAPISQSKDLICVARNVHAEYKGRSFAKNGDLWSALKEA